MEKIRVALIFFVTFVTFLSTGEKFKKKAIDPYSLCFSREMVLFRFQRRSRNLSFDKQFRENNSISPVVAEEKFKRDDYYCLAVSRV